MSQVLFIVATDSECGIGLHRWPSKLLDCLHSWSGLLHHLTVSLISCKGKHTNVPFHFCTNQTQAVTHSDTAETCKHDLFWILEIKNFRYIQTVVWDVRAGHCLQRFVGKFRLILGNIPSPVRVMTCGGRKATFSWSSFSNTSGTPGR